MTDKKINISDLSIKRYRGRKLPVCFRYDKKDQFLVDFYNNDAKHLDQESITYTFDVYYKEAMIAYYAFTLGQITAKELGKGKKITHLTHPAIKLGMALVTKTFQKRNIGTCILAKIIKVALTIREVAPIRFVVVDATPDAVNFYKKRGFGILSKKGDTILMFLDIDKLIAGAGGI